MSPCRRTGAAGVLGIARRAVAAFAAGAALCAWSGAAPADDYPSRTIRFVVPFAAGTTVDIRARQVADRISKSLGQSVIVENRAGAGATIGAAHVARAAADGYTILVGSIADQAVAPNVYPNLPYDPRRDFAPITQYAETAPILVAHPGLGVSSVQEMIALAKRKPGEVFVGSWGNGTLTHLLTLQLAQLADIRITHVPYRSSSQALTDTVGGQISMTWDYPVSSMRFIQAGQLNALMVIGDRRVDPLPDIPSAAEAGLPEMRHLAWGGFFAPAGTPKHVVDRLNREIVRALNTPDMKALFAEQGSRVVTNSPEEFAAFVRREQDALAALAQSAGARTD
jgi:tripartite-type tricarboxylate transporter receptor subunit TctC